MGTEAHPRPQKPLRRHGTLQDLRELLKQLRSTETHLLHWLLRYPFQRAEDLALAGGISLATAYRHLTVLEELGLIEEMIPGALGAGTCRLYHLSNLGLHVVARQKQKDPRSLAQAWGSDERGLLRLLPRLARLVVLQDYVNGFVLYAPEALAHLGRRSEVRWHWVRDYAHHFSYREKGIRCTVDAGLLLRIRPATERSISRQEQWYSMFLLLDTDIADIVVLRQRLKRLLCYRECAERWPVYQHFPLILILVHTSHRIEHWQRCAVEMATTLRVAPLTGAIASVSAESGITILDPWRLTWKTLSTNVECRLPNLVGPLPVEAIPPDLRDAHAPDDVSSMSTQTKSSAPSTLLRPPKIISGHFAACAEDARRGKMGHCYDEQEEIALLGLSVSHRDLALLNLLLDHPFLHRNEMAALLDLEASSIERYLRALRSTRCIDALATPLGERWRLNERGLSLVARAQHLNIQSIAEPEDEKKGAGFLQRGQDVLLQHLEHTGGIYGFFTLLSQAAKQERVEHHEHRLLWWETGTVCERRYRDHDHWHNLRPDAMGEYQAGERQVRFWLEWDRATMGTRDLMAKFNTYAHYVACREWWREKSIVPFLLVVAPGKEQEMRIARVATAVLANTSRLVMRITTATRLADQGPLAAIWYQVLPSIQPAGTALRRRFYEKP